MKQKFISKQETISKANKLFEAFGFPPEASEEKLKQFLLYKGWIDTDGNITEEGIKSGMLKMGPHVDLN